MIEKLSSRFRQTIAGWLSLVLFLQIISPLHSIAAGGFHSRDTYYLPVEGYMASHRKSKQLPTGFKPIDPMNGLIKRMHNQKRTFENHPMPLNSGYRIGGPSSPEASSFKAVGSDNLVNLFTGDFSYNIPLLDLGGYPVNLFYNGGITMEQEASWVGLGWNINAGSVSRNMRGVPDDFDGSDVLTQTQNVKPNKTWGGEVGVDGEVVGIKKPNVNFNVGFSYNNYLGPELDLGAGVSVSIPLMKTAIHEKAAPLDSSQGLNLSLGANAKLSSRSGFTLSPSLNAGLHGIDKMMDLGVGLNTSYSSRTGIKALNISSQISAYKYQDSKKGEIENNNSYRSSINVGLTSSTISFARPSYLPTLRMPMQYANYSGQIELGTGMFGLRGAGTAQGYYSTSKVADGATTLTKPLVGFMYLEKAIGHKDAVMDFNRLNDGEVTPNTPVISAPQYDYDIFSIQGEGTGGTIRAYRGDLGFVRDNETTSKDNNISIGFDIAPPGHYGGNWNIISTPTRSGGWDDANNTLNQTLQFNSPQTNSSFENVYFRNPGESTVTNDNLINKIGQDNLVRFKLSGSAVSPRLESQLEQFNKKTGKVNGNNISLANANATQQRDKRTQVITMVNATDASQRGLETSIRNYQSTLDASNNLQFNSIPRVGGYRKGNHISEIDVLEGSGMRYVYGLPIYNTLQKELTFSVGAVNDPVTNLVTYAAADTTIASSHINSNTGIDGYVNIQQIPPYASSFLLTGLLSPDYVDVKGDGITEDDLGNAVKFNYAMSGYHTWRTPRNNSTSTTAHFNAGLKSEKRDNKATISYGQREVWYIHSIESKSMIAVFKASARSDGKGVNTGGDAKINTTENANLKLDSILLYAKADIRANGLAGAVPLKTVHFEYAYSLCNGTPDNSSNGGKLTLNDIYFTFNGQSRAAKNMYVFNYGNISANLDNPVYSYNASDRWGTYKPMLDSLGNAVNPNKLSNIDYPYTSGSKSMVDQYAGAWSLKKILLPSGGQIEVQYEADDYAYVQNRRSCNMFNIYGIGSSTDYTQGNMLYTIFSNQDQNYVYIQLPSALQNTDPVKLKQEIYAKYLDGINQLALKLNINMPKGMEPLTVYANYDDYGICTNSTDNKTIYIKLRTIDGKSPLANASVHFLMENLPGQAFPGYDMSDNTGITAFLDLITSGLGSLAKAFKNAENQVRSGGGGSSVSLANSFIRLNNPAFTKFGGGHRVKRILMKDNWSAMSGQYTSQYGQDYDYTTTTMVNGISTTISSGVASYEPGIGSEENPFREILQFENKLPLASAQYGAVEMPMLEGLYPSPTIGYSKVTVRSINRNGTQGTAVVKSAIGKQVTEFYTAKDYPTFSAYTPMANMDYHRNPPFSFLYKETIDRRSTSQGFLVQTNDMHGKLKIQAAYSESDENTPLSYTYHTYKNTGVNGLNDKVDFIHNDQKGAVVSGNMGVDMELMTDVREFSVMSKGFNGQIQTDFFTFVPWPIFGIFMYPIQSYTENKYRAVTTTKLINFHAIEDSVLVNDKGSIITTKTIAYDAETGSPIVTQTLNEFNDPVYNISCPAYWAYSGVGPAYQNIGMQFSGVDFSDGKIVSGVSNQNVFESGDEIFISASGSGSPSCIPASANVSKLWAVDINKNTTSLTVPASSKDLIFLDSAGNPYTGSSVNFSLARSGKRNNLMYTVSSATTMQNPFQTINGTRQLVIDNATNVVAASASAYKEKWQVDRDVILKTTTAVVNCVPVETVDCSGLLEKHINPYVKGLLGSFKPYRSYTYYELRKETDPSINTTIRKNGYINGFSNYWTFDANSNLVPDNSNTKWVWNSELTRVNSKGQELETKDPLNRYTAAQYGFAKNLPIAMVQNGMYGDSFSESFEDYNYQERINPGSVVNCSSDRYIDFSSVGSSTSILNITDTTSLPVKAHTGKAVLKIQAGAGNTATLPINVSNPYPFDYNFILQKDTARSLNTLGGNSSFVSHSGLYWDQTTSTFSTSGNSQFAVDVYPSEGNFHYYSNYDTTYIQVTFQQTYNFQITLNTAYNNIATQQYANAMHVAIVDLNGITKSDVTFSKPLIFNGSAIATDTYNYSVALCPGIYKIVSDMTESYNQPTNPSDSHNSYIWKCTNSTSPDYKNLSTVGGCISTKPMPATDTMINRSFALVPGKQMVFSAWVQEDCGNATGTPCYATNYVNNHVAIQFPGSSTAPVPPIHSTGTIIDGWQKIELVFTVPADATSASLALINDGSRDIYFDDVRIYPFNAEMKSYVYDPKTLRLSAELDENNYATFYNYDEEGQLIRVKKETVEGVKTIKETRSAKQKNITTLQ